MGVQVGGSGLMSMRAGEGGGGDWKGLPPMDNNIGAGGVVWCGLSMWMIVQCAQGK